MPEHIALWSLKHFGSRASSAVEKLRELHPDAAAGELERIVIAQQTRRSMTEGALVGGPFVVLIPVAFCAALLAQAQMALELAALAGYAPTDRMRAADLLVLQGAYASTSDAGAALTKVAPDPKRGGRRLPRGTRWRMIKRMAFLLGVIGSTDEKKSRLRSALQTVLLGSVFIVGLVLPFAWVPYMARAFRKSGLLLGERATKFYAEGHGAEAGVTVRNAQTVRIGMSAGLVRLLALIVFPVAVALIALLTGTDVGGGKWLTAWILLIAVSGLTTLAWLAYRWWRPPAA